jgi:hypothetical protein
MRNVPVQILNMADTGSKTGLAFETQQIYSASFCPIFGDTSAAGTVKIQGSNDSPVGPIAQFIPTNWNDIPNATSLIVAGLGPAIIVQTLNFQFIRAVFTSTNSGNTTIVVNASLYSV